MTTRLINNGLLLSVVHSQNYITCVSRDSDGAAKAAGRTPCTFLGSS